MLFGAGESTINAGGSGYDPGDVLTVAATDLAYRYCQLWCL